MNRIIHVHLVSDSTGETVCSVSRAVVSQFEGLEAEEHVWSLVRTKEKINQIFERIETYPGIIMYTLVQKDLGHYLQEESRKRGVKAIPVLSPVIAELANYLNMKVKAQPGRQHELDEGYFTRVEAVNYTIAHDDGQLTGDLEEADIVLVGVSRTSKSPTCMYLAHRGYRVANIPFVAKNNLPDTLFSLTRPLIVGLTINAETLVQIRKNRLLSLKQEVHTPYIDIEAIKEELREARRLFTKHQWPVIDVTRRSVEETAAAIIQWYQERQEKKRKE